MFSSDTFQIMLELTYHLLGGGSKMTDKREQYDSRLEKIDEQICGLINKRKSIASKSSFPSPQLITTWSTKYDLYEDFLDGLFHHLLHEDLFKPYPDPKGFRKNIPILKSYERDNLFFTVTFVRQYENASIVNLTLDKEPLEENAKILHEFTFLELSIENNGVEYDCRDIGGGGSDGHMSHTYTVSPPLPDDMSAVKFLFKEYKEPFQREPTGIEFVIAVAE